MEVIPVLDVRDGIAVHASGGDRSRYPPLASRLAPTADPRALARAIRERLALDRVYVADLDAIAAAGREPPSARSLRSTCALVAELAASGTRVWIDAGVEAAEACEQLLEAGAARVVIGLETLSSLEALERVAREIAGERLVFSLDLRDGRPITAGSASDCRGRMSLEGHPGDRPRLAGLAAGALVDAAVAAGFQTVIVLDLDRVGSRQGPGLDLLRDVRGRAPAVRWVAGGGVRAGEDLRALACAGWNACLVGTAIHNGTIGASELRPLARTRSTLARIDLAAERPRRA